MTHAIQVVSASQQQRRSAENSDVFKQLDQQNSMSENSTWSAFADSLASTSQSSKNSSFPIKVIGVDDDGEGGGVNDNNDGAARLHLRGRDSRAFEGSTLSAFAESERFAYSSSLSANDWENSKTAKKK